MAGPLIQIEAWVLRRLPPSDAFQRLVLFDAAHGTLTVLHRMPRKPNPDQINPDLFDEVAGVVEGGSAAAGGFGGFGGAGGAGGFGDAGGGGGGLGFVKELRVVARHERIGRDYETLQRASAFASLVARNPVPEESRVEVFALLRTVFAAFASGAPPAVVYLKGCYRFARDEGYPVRQQWLATLSPGLRAAAGFLLQTPLAEIGRCGLQLRDGDVLVRRLAEYLRGHTELEVE
ncbi:MAG: hypothetical protein LBK99_16095 [Opitutaceae bacterium]|nr:hypothetical protein [Opitutaceae bacterium]